MDTTQLGMVTLGATQGIAIFTTLLPSRTQLYAATPCTSTRQNLRQGELVAGVLTLAFASVLAYLCKDKMPLFIAGATIITMITAYEFTMHIQPEGTENELS